MAVSPAVRQYYAREIFAKSGRDKAPPNFQPLEVPHSGMSSVEGCRGGGKNILEVYVVCADDTLQDVRMSCGLCNPAMYVAADIVAGWARGQKLDDVLAVPVTDFDALAPFYEILGGPGMPDDAREKFQYALHATQNAIRDSRGQACPGEPDIAEPTDVDHAEGAEA